MLKDLNHSLFVENLLEVKEAGDFFRSANDQFPLYGDGHRASINMHLYMATMNLKIF